MEIQVQVKKSDETKKVSPFNNVTVAVVGTGLVGKSWAIVFSRAGFLFFFFNCRSFFFKKLFFKKDVK